jgi:hypothetical protein
MKQREKQIPKGGEVYLRQALDRLIDLYNAWGKQDQAAKWRAIRDGKGPPAKPPPAPTAEDGASRGHDGKRRPEVITQRTSWQQWDVPVWRSNSGQSSVSTGSIVPIRSV